MKRFVVAVVATLTLGVTGGTIFATSASASPENPSDLDCDGLDDDTGEPLSTQRANGVCGGVF